MVNGIYQILNTVNNKRYIGSSTRTKNRLEQHKTRLKNGYHVNAFLQNAVNKYGLDKFRFELILECDRDNLEFYEDLIISGYKTNTKDFGYNLRKVTKSNAGLEFRERWIHKSGDKYNYLTLIKPLGLTPRGARLWECLCDCGTAIQTTAGSIRHGNRKSCGCHSKYSHFHKSEVN